MTDEQIKAILIERKKAEKKAAKEAIFSFCIGGMSGLIVLACMVL